MSVEDKLKEAAKHFLVSAAIFDKIKLEIVNLKLGENGLDLSEPNLLMCGYIVKAHAQYCAFEKVKRTAPNNYTLLSRLAMQASTFYGKAYSLAATPPMSKAVDLKNFASVLHFNEYAFLAQAHYWVAQQYQQSAEETAVGIGKSIAHITKSYEALEMVKKLEKSLSPAILTQYKDLIKHYAERKAYLEDRNNKIYHEPVPKKVEEIECLQYTQPFSLEEDLNRPFEGRDIFSRLVPPVVRTLDDEYKLYVGSIINIAMQWINSADAEHEAFLMKHDLPSCLHAASGEQKLPEDLWAKIQQCKEKGGMKFLRHTFDGMHSMCESSETTLTNLRSQLQYEEEDDENMRAKYGSKWTRTKSRDLSAGMWKQLDYYQSKLEACKKADQHIKELLETKEEYLELIEFDRGEIVAKIPKSSHAERQLSFVASKLVGLMKTLGELKKDAQAHLQEMMKTLETDNVTNELFQIHQVGKEKKAVFGELSQKYAKHQKSIEEAAKKRHETLGEVQKLMVEFVKEKSGDEEDPNRIEFFKQIDDACNTFNKCHSNLQQGAHFYTQLVGHLGKFSQTVNDFVVSRGLEKNELLAQINGFGTSYVPPPPGTRPPPPQYSVAGQYYLYQENLVTAPKPGPGFQPRYR